MASLVAVEGKNAGTAYPIEGQRYVLGRQPDCDLYEVFENETGVSRHHACISKEDGRYRIEDMGSRNGTFVNGCRLSARTDLASGDRLSIGAMIFEFRPAAAGDESAQTQSLLSDISSVVLDQQQESVVQAAIPVKTKTATDEDIARNPARKLKALVGLLAKMGESLDVDEMLDQLLGGLFEVFPTADRGFVGISNDEGKVIPRAVRHRRQLDHMTFRISRALVDSAISTGQAILSADAADDSRFENSRSIQSINIRSVLCVPLIDRKGDAMGVIQLDRIDDSGGFDQQDLEVLASITPHAATALDYARIHADEVKRQALKRDLELARTVQRNLLPHSDPQIEGYEFYSFYEAANEVGGDYYDYIGLPDGRLGVVVADVVGKGVPAALLMSRLAGEWKYLLSREESPCLAAACMNEELYDEMVMGQFVTLLAVILDARNHHLTIVSAGHPDPLLQKSDGSVAKVSVDTGGPPLGMLPSQEYGANSLDLEPGDALVMYTDGLSEAMRSDGTLYGSRRLCLRLEDGPNNAPALGEHILTDIEQFVDGHPQSDDMCLICFRRVS